MQLTATVLKVAAVHGLYWKYFPRNVKTALPAACIDWSGGFKEREPGDAYYACRSAVLPAHPPPPNSRPAGAHTLASTAL